MFIQDQVLNDTYEIRGRIGSGGTSAVYLAYHRRLKKNVVIKQIQGSFSEDFFLRVEVDILKNLHHPNLPQVYDFIQDRDSVYTVIDFVDGADLETYIRSGTRFTEQQLRWYLRQIGEVLVYLHGQNPPVYHSDIKPGNIIINQDGNAVLIDFNISIGGNWGNILGLTLPYASPEQITIAQYVQNGMAPPLTMDGRSDLYSLGATFYELICGICPRTGTPPTPLCQMNLPGYSREFLALVDRLMAYDRNKRIKSAKRLVTSLDRMDSLYRTYFALRCVSLLLSAALIAGGVFCLITGSRQKVQENYRQQYAAMTARITAGDLEEADRICDGILADGEIQSLLQKDATAAAQLYHAMGDLAYYQGEYAVAAADYAAAVSGCDASDSAVLSAYLRDAAIAYAQNGDLQSAQQYLESAKARQAASDDLLLVEIVLDARQGRVEECLRGAETLLGRSSQTEVCLRAATCAASAAADVDSRILWLERARVYGAGKTAIRNLAAAYGEKAQSASSTEKQQAALNQALDLYRDLNDSEFASLEDRLNYSVVLRMAGQLQDAITVLKRAAEDYPDQDRILMNLCFLYNELGDPTQTSIYCAAAIRAWQANTAPNRLSESSDEIQNLLELGRRYGIGGSQ